MSNRPNLSFLIFLNAILHTISAALAGVWIAELVAGSGDMTALAWFETVLAVIAIAAGLTTASIVAMRFIPTLPPSRRGKVKAAFVTVYAPFALALAVIAAATLGAPAGERAHIEFHIERMRAETVAHRRAVSEIENRLPFLDECHATALSMSGQEARTGAFSREGGDFGRVAVSLANVANACAISRDTIYSKRSYLSRQFGKAESLLLELRRVIDGDGTRHQKRIAVRKLGDEWGRVMRSIKDSMATDALFAAADSVRRDWMAAGLPSPAARAITENFQGIGEQLIVGTEDIAALKAKDAAMIPTVSTISYLYLYPEATTGGLAIGLIIELVPLAIIVLAMGMAERSQEQREPRPISEGGSRQTEALPKRPYNRRRPKGDA